MIVKILVDADACPVKHLIVKLAKRHGLPVTMLIDSSHIYADGYSNVITVDPSPDSVDIALVNMTSAGDIVVTQDFGLAAMALGKGAYAINQNGMVYDNSNIDKLLFERFLGKKVRRGGGRTAGPSRRTNADDTRFETAFERLILSVL